MPKVASSRPTRRESLTDARVALLASLMSHEAKMLSTISATDAALDDLDKRLGGLARKADRLADAKGLARASALGSKQPTPMPTFKAQRLAATPEMRPERPAAQRTPAKQPMMSLQKAEDAAETAALAEPPPSPPVSRKRTSTSQPVASGSRGPRVALDSPPPRRGPRVLESGEANSPQHFTPPRVTPRGEVVWSSPELGRREAPASDPHGRKPAHESRSAVSPASPVWLRDAESRLAAQASPATAASVAAALAACATMSEKPGSPKAAVKAPSGVPPKASGASRASCGTTPGTNASRIPMPAARVHTPRRRSLAEGFVEAAARGAAASGGGAATSARGPTSPAATRDATSGPASRTRQLPAHDEAADDVPDEALPTGRGGEATFPWTPEVLPFRSPAKESRAAAGGALPGFVLDRDGRAGSPRQVAASSGMPSPWASAPASPRTVPSPRTVHSPPPPPPELSECATLLRGGRLVPAFELCFDVLGRCMLDGALLAAMLLVECEPRRALHTMPTHLAAEITHLITEELTASVGTQDDTHNSRTATRFLRGYVASYISRSIGEGGGSSSTSFGGRSLLAAAGAPVEGVRLLEWVEHATQLRRTGGEDYLSGPLGTQLAQTLRTLSSSSDPSVGVEAARLFALLGAQRRPERRQTFSSDGSYYPSTTRTPHPTSTGFVPATVSARPARDTGSSAAQSYPFGSPGAPWASARERVARSDAFSPGSRQSYRASSAVLAASLD